MFIWQVVTCYHKIYCCYFLYRHSYCLDCSCCMFLFTFLLTLLLLKSFLPQLLLPSNHSALKSCNRSLNFGQIVLLVFKQDAFWFCHVRKYIGELHYSKSPSFCDKPMYGGTLVPHQGWEVPSTPQRSKIGMTSPDYWPCSLLLIGGSCSVPARPTFNSCLVPSILTGTLLKKLSPLVARNIFEAVS